MRYCFIIPLILVCLAGCAQSARQHPAFQGRIPVDGHRWYQLTNAGSDLNEVFDGQLEQKPNTGYNKLIQHYEAWYPLYNGEQMTIDSILFFCYRGINNHHPVQLIAVMADWKRISIATFNPGEVNKWYGPYPATPDVYGLRQPITGFRYLVLDSWGEFPAEIELYGSYTPTTATKQKTARFPLSNYFGINTYEWDIESPQTPDKPDMKRAGGYAPFSAIRHYLDWEKLEHTEGNYTFNPARNGRWNYDTFYATMQQQGKEVLACIKTIPDWLQQTYPEGQRNNENIPAPYSVNLEDPASYILQARLAFQFTARYGRNSLLIDSLLRVDARPMWPGGPYNRIRKGLGTVRYIECDNERDKWWKGRTAYQTGREYAANLSAFYDGHKGALGPGVGVKNADTGMQVVMGGLANPNPGYVQAIVDWSAEHRGYKDDGTVDVPFDILNFHYYCNNANGTDKEATTGVAPELTTTAQVATAFVQLAARIGKKRVWVTETGYDINDASPQLASGTGGLTAEETQGIWLVRTALLFARCGIERMFTYQMFDDKTNGSERYATSGLLNDDRSYRPAASYFLQISTTLGGYVFDSTISTAPLIDRYIKNADTMYVMMQVQPGNQEKKATLYLPGWKNARVLTLHNKQKGLNIETYQPAGGSLKVELKESPIFITNGPL